MITVICYLRIYGDIYGEYGQRFLKYLHEDAIKRRINKELKFRGDLSR